MKDFKIGDRVRLRGTARKGVISGAHAFFEVNFDDGTHGARIAEELIRLKPKLKLEFVPIPAGSFVMGSPESEKGRYSDEKQKHVTLTKGFEMGKTQVTQKQWKRVMGTDPSRFKGENLPVEKVSWNDIQEFIAKLNAKKDGYIYRLPTEAEWEYACRAGSTTAYPFGDDPKELKDYAWFCENSDQKTHEVGQKKPNAWGLYDMLGNVWEWVEDFYGK